MMTLRIIMAMNHLQKYPTPMTVRTCRLVLSATGICNGAILLKVPIVVVGIAVTFIDVVKITRHKLFGGSALIARMTSAASAIQETRMAVATQAKLLLLLHSRTSRCWQLK
jgi:hypothetical protein